MEMNQNSGHSVNSIREFFVELIGYIKYHVFEAKAVNNSLRYKSWAISRLFKILLLGRKNSVPYLFPVDLTITNKYGQFFVPKNSDIVFSISSGSEVSIEKYFQVPYGKTFLDIGANVGKYSIMLANSGAKVFSFEPNPYTYSVLKRNIELNKLSELISSLNLGVSDSIGELEFAISNTFTGVSHMVSTNTHQFDEFDYDIIKVNVNTIDKLLIEKNVSIIDIFLVKIDVEGHEYNVLKGGEFLLEHMPKTSKVIVEIHENFERINRIVSLMEQYSFQPNRLSKENWVFVKNK